MAFQTDLILNKEKIGFEYYRFIFFATLFSYHIYYIKSKENKWHLFFSSISSILSIYFLFKIGTHSYYILALIALLSLSYIIPSILDKKNKWLSIYKLVALTSVWFLTTCIFPLENYNLIIENTSYFFYQFIFIFLLCFHFYIRDEVKIETKYLYQLIIISVNFIFVFFSLLLFLFLPYYFFINLSFLLLSIYIYKKQPSKLFYLVFVDGMLLLQPIFAYLLYNK